MAGKLEMQARELVGKNWSKSSLTREKLLGNIERISHFMEKQGLQKIQDMKTKHVQRFVQDMQGRSLSSSTQAGYLTVLRVMASAIGKQNIVARTNKEYGISRAGLRYMPKTANHEKLSDIRQQLYERGHWQGLAFDMQREFGLRLKESLLSNKIIEKDGDRYLSVEGGKGGRSREIKIDTEGKNGLVARLHDYLHDHGQKTIIPPDKTLKQAYDRMSNDVHRCGGLKKLPDGSSANPHANRHAYAQERLADGSSRADVAQELGHGREEVVKHYAK